MVGVNVIGLAFAVLHTMIVGTGHHPSALMDDVFGQLGEGKMPCRQPWGSPMWVDDLFHGFF